MSPPSIAARPGRGRYFAVLALVLLAAACSSGGSADLTTGRVHRLGGTGHLGGEGEGIAYAKTAGAVLHTLTLDAIITPNYADHWKLVDA